MKNKFMASLALILISVSGIASTACLCQAAEKNKTAESHNTYITVENYDDTTTFNNIDNFHVYCTRELAHTDNKALVIGEDENTYLTIKATPANRKDTDFLFFYDDSVISSDLVSIKNDEKANESEITLKINKQIPGSTKLRICSGYDYYTKGMEGEDYNIDEFDFINLDNTEGTVAYMSTADGTYSFAKTADKDAVATTLYDVELMGLTQK